MEVASHAARTPGTLGPAEDATSGGSMTRMAGRPGVELGRRARGAPELSTPDATAAQWPLLLLAVWAVAAPLAAGANGMPAEVTPTAGGYTGIVPLETSGVELVSERLRMTLRYARAEYTLRNRGAPRTLRYAVPLAYHGSTFEGPNLAFPHDWDFTKDGVEAGLAALEITLAGRRVECSFKPERRVRYSPAADLQNAVEAWCVANITVPTGEAIPLVLVTPLMRGEALPFTRTTYALWPAGHWKGPVRSLDIELDLGVWADAARVVSPPGGVREGRLVRWRWQDVDLRTLGSVVVEHTQEGANLMPPWRFARWLRAPAKITAAASSTLPPQGRFDYTAARLLDGDSRTAWCEGAAGDGIGETVELALAVERPTGDAECRLLRLDLLTGLRWDEEAYQANGRVSKVRVERCEDPKDGFDVDLARDPEPWELRRLIWELRDDDAAGDRHIELHVPRGMLDQEPSCLRLRVLGARPGRKFHDTCLAEVVPHVYCRKRDADARPPRPASLPLPDPKAFKASLSPEDARCADEVNGLVKNATHGGYPDAWARLLAACAACARPFEDDRRDPLAWRRCEVARRFADSSMALEGCRARATTAPPYSPCSPQWIAGAFGARLREVEDREGRQLTWFAYWPR